jgi:replicative DNA helicase
MPGQDDNLHKVPPQNLEAESSVLGGILLENDAINVVLELLRTEDFYRESHRKIFRAMIELSDRSEPVDIITLSECLKNRGDLEAIGGSSYLAALNDFVPTAANIAYYARIVREKSILRRLISAATEVATRGYEGAGNVEELLDSAEKAIFDITEQRIKGSFVKVGEMMKDSIKMVEKLFERKTMITGVPTGFKDLDAKTAGLQPSDLIIVAARPGMGKTAFSLNIASHAAFAGYGVAIFSLEMAKEQLALRLLCSEARVDNARVRTGYLSDRDFPKLATAAGKLHDALIYIDDTPAISVLEVRAKARRLALDREKKLGLIIVDYLQLMRGSGAAQNREQEISEISRSLKALAKELTVPVLAISQLNRRVEDRNDKTPQLSDLRESGAIEQDADVIAFIYREAAYNTKSDDNTATITVAKQRNGPTGDITLTFLREFTRFEDYSGRDEEFYEDAAEEA